MISFDNMFHIKNFTPSIVAKIDYYSVIDRIGDVICFVVTIGYQSTGSPGLEKLNPTELPRMGRCEYCEFFKTNESIPTKPNDIP